MGNLHGLLLATVLAATASARDCRSGSTSNDGDGAAAASAAPVAAPAGGHAGVEPCAVVTQKEASAALGGDPGPGKSSVTAAGTGRCTYTSDAGTLMVTVTPNQSQADYTRAHDKAAKDAHPGTFGEVAEVGNSAYSTWGGPMASIQFYKGGTAVYIMLTVGSLKAPPKAQVNTLALAAAGRV